MPSKIYRAALGLACAAACAQAAAQDGDFNGDTLHRFSYAQLAVPALAAGMTIIQCTRPSPSRLDLAVKNRVSALDFRSKVDDYLQYAPAAAGLALGMAEAKGRERIDKVIILAMASVFELALVNTMKYSIGTLRPDGSARNSFPSGHTATAFMGAEFLRREYGHKSVLCAVGGYAAAVFTGYMRIQNNRHWLSDVVTGAAVGIFSTQAAYWLYPCVRRVIFPQRDGRYALVLMPRLSAQQWGINAAIVF